MRSRMERFVPRSRSTILRFFDDLMGILRVAKCRRHFTTTTTTTTYSLSAELLLTSHEENENICVCFILKRERFVTSFQLFEKFKTHDVNLFHITEKRNGRGEGSRMSAINMKTQVFSSRYSSWALVFCVVYTAQSSRYKSTLTHLGIEMKNYTVREVNACLFISLDIIQVTVVTPAHADATWSDTSAQLMEFYGPI